MSIGSCALISGHEMEESQVEITSCNHVLGDLPVAVTVAYNMFRKDMSWDMDTVCSTTTVFEKWKPARVGENLVGSFILRIGNIFVVKGTREHGQSLIEISVVRSQLANRQLMTKHTG
jgi:hypothetical protein